MGKDARNLEKKELRKESKKKHAFWASMPTWIFCYELMQFVDNNCMYPPTLPRVKRSRMSRDCIRHLSHRQSYRLHISNLCEVTHPQVGATNTQANTFWNSIIYHCNVMEGTVNLSLSKILVINTFCITIASVPGPGPKSDQLDHQLGWTEAARLKLGSGL